MAVNTTYTSTINPAATVATPAPVMPLPSSSYNFKKTIK